MNPILQMLNSRNNILPMISALRNQNPQALYRQMMNSNPQFKQFIEENQGKTVDQIASEHGIDINEIKSFLYTK